MPLLTIVIASRNDTYMGDSNWRLQTTINFMAENVAELGKGNELEIIVVDWGSDIPLEREIVLKDYSRKITRFITVPIALIEEKLGSNIFADNIAINTAIRRSKGMFVGYCGNDVLWTTDLFRTLFTLLETTENTDSKSRGNLIVIPRKHIPSEIVNQNLSIEKLKDFILNYDDFLPVE